MFNFGLKSFFVSFIVVVVLPNSPSHAYGPYSRTSPEEEQWGGVGGGKQIEPQQTGYGQQSGSSYQSSERYDNNQYPSTQSGTSQQSQSHHHHQCGQGNFFGRQTHIEKFGYPEGCVNAGTHTCNYFVEVSREEYDPGFIHFELSGIVQKTGGYIAVGLSEDKFMGEDHIVECVHLRDNSTRYYQSWSVGRQQPRRLQDDVSVIKMDETYPRYDHRTGVLTCKFRRPIETLVNVDNGVSKNYNLVTGQYHILLAKGNLAHTNSDKTGFHGNANEGNVYVSHGFLGDNGVINEKCSPTLDQRNDSRFSSGSGNFTPSSVKGIPIVFVFMFLSHYIG
ncbi:unnamed protein product [Orchesella dallaii]|uniref:DOMON domain-containing protein n=1 Tax=Orchesella dallaii TaxID=48710 RepID=A0ABP1QPJ9_9HEXA